MIRPAFAALAALLFPAAAMAGDARIVSHRFNAEEVVRIQGQLGIQASIAFAENEQIENVAVGDSASWQITPNKRANLLFVKPLSPRARTNMTVVTDRRTYFFDLAAAVGGPPLYVLRFTYPDEPKPIAPAPALAMSAEEAQAVAAPPKEAPVDPAKLNFAWRTRGKAALLPSRIYDDGESTYLTWPRKASLPAMQVKNEKGVEGPVNYAVRGEVIVVEGVPDAIVLRAGKDAAELRRQNPPQAAEAPPPRGGEPALAAKSADSKSQ
jgi:type IV secretion system protein VirB9